MTKALFEQATLDLLLENNVYNIKLPYKEVSIVHYLKTYATAVGDRALAKMFIQKVSKLLVSNNKYLSAVRELPQDAPDWAQQALANQELMAFQPTDELNREIEHITHYLSALVVDRTNTTDNDKKVKAEREINSFHKNGSLEEIVKKSQEYFKRGTGDRNTDGMVEIHEFQGNKWYLLQTPEAFQREGQTLQNCIGGHYTPANCKSAGESIVVMRKRNGETVIGARIKNKDNELQEMKGKNNRPPVDRYMPAVLEFVRKRKFTLRPYAASDFAKTGYFYIKGGLYARQEAIDKFFKGRVLGKTEGGYDVVEVIVDSADLALVYRDAYPSLEMPHISRYQPFEAHANKFYDLRKSNSKHAIISARVDTSSKTLMAISNNKVQIAESITEANDHENASSKNGQDFIKALYSLNVIRKLASRLQHRLLWSNQLTFDENGTMKRADGTKEQHHSQGHNWTKYTDKTHITALMKNVVESYQYGPTFQDLTIKALYIQKHETEQRADRYFNVCVAETDDYLIPLILNEHGNSPSGTVSIRHKETKAPLSRYAVEINYGDAKVPRIRDTKTVGSIVALANKKHLELPMKFKVINGLITGDKDKHERYIPKAEKHQGPPAYEFYDLSKTPKAEKSSAINTIVTTGAIRSPTGKADSNDVAAYDLRHHKANHNAWNEDGHSHGNEHNPTTTTTHIDSAIKGFSGLDGIYVATVDYGHEGKHKIVMAAHGDEIVGFDQTTKDHDFQHWDDFEKIADQLNKFADNAKVTFKNGILPVRSSKELRMVRGRVVTGTSIAKKASNREEPTATDELPLANGSKVTKLTDAEHATYVRKVLELSTPGPVSYTHLTLPTKA